MAAEQRIFISYSHHQGDWVLNRILPVLHAAGAGEVLIDLERFRAGRGVKGQMDATQDQASRHLLVLSPEYLASDYCRHEMHRALASDSEFARGAVVPVQRHACDMSVLNGKTDELLWVDLRDDRRPDAWELLLKSLMAAQLGARAVDWLQARDACWSKLVDERVSVNLLVHGKTANWRGLIEDLAQRIPRFGAVDLDDPETIDRRGLVAQILRACGQPVGKMARKQDDLIALKQHLDGVVLALTHFDHASRRQQHYEADLFATLRFLEQERKLTLLFQSRRRLRELLPADHELSKLTPQTVELRSSAP
jgi:hypothetical protein